MRKSMPVLVCLGLAACDLATEPDTRSEANQLELRAQWHATVSGVGGSGSSTITGTTDLQEYRSYFDAATSIDGAQATTAYQWRIYGGSCAATAAADLTQVGPNQAYPDLVTNSSGSASVARLMAGALDSAAAYSVRIRLAVAATTWNGTNPLACGDLQRS